MDTIRLRKLSRKSRFEAGKYPDLTVQDLLNLNQRYYLASLYFKYENISYLDDILEELFITDELVIEKPGSNYKLFPKWKWRYCENVPIKERRNAASSIKSVNKKKAESYEHSVYMSKSNLRNKNRRLSS